MKKQKIYAQNLHYDVREQFNSAMEQSFTVQGALMPDAHLGYSLPIGAVIATKDVIVPSWVGYDIGCGMLALMVTCDVVTVRDHKQEIFDRIYEEIPVGFNVHQHSIKHDMDENLLSHIGKAAFENRKGFRSLGTLGGGNHFIEIGMDMNGKVWIVIHSGSRSVGHGIATEYMKIASGTDKPKEGHYGLIYDSIYGELYLNDMNWALDFAMKNRQYMAEKVVAILGEFSEATANWNTQINKTHNHVKLENDLWVHRKGATQAHRGILGVIPGNMRDGSFIVEGLGNPESLSSSSHGAGRVMGRNQAKKRLNMDEFKDQMENIQAKVEESTLDESPLAYKDIHEVMDLQEDLVFVLNHIKPIINIKG